MSVRGRTSFVDVFREGCPATAVTPENIDAVRDLLQIDRLTTYDKIEATMCIGTTAIRTILHEHDDLAVRKMCARRVPHNLTEKKTVKKKLV